MPDGRIVIHTFPTGYAWEKSIHHDELFRLRRKLRGIRIRNHESDVVTDDSRFLDAQGLGKCVNSDSRGLHVQTVRWNLRITDPGKVRRNHGKSLGEERHDWFPHAGRLRITVQQDHRRAMTSS